MPDDRSHELAETFSRFGPAFVKWMKSGTRSEGLTFARMRLLLCLRGDSPRIMSELKDQLGVTARNVTTLVDGLEAEGHVRRKPHPEDRRATLIELTEAGAEVVDRVHGAHLERAARLFSRLEAEEQAQLQAIMGRLLTALDDEGVTPPPATPG